MALQTESQLCIGWKHGEIRKPCILGTIIGMETSCLLNSRPYAHFSTTCDYCARIRSVLFEHRRDIFVNPRQGVALNLHQRNGFGSAVISLRELKELIAKNPESITLSKAALKVKDFPDRSKIFFLDTEFAVTRKDQPNVLLELALVNWEGKIVFDSKTDYGMKCDEFFERYACDQSDYWRFHSIAKVIGKPRNEAMNEILIEDVVHKLIELGIGRDSLIVEWSTSSCDWKWLSTLFEQAELMYYAPLKSMIWRPLLDYRRVLPGLTNHQLETVFPLLFPDHNLVNRNHRALPDTQMTRLLNLEFMKMAEHS
jgi:hypothetical protein